jgi:general L-amino acid transport system permease protein
MLPAEPPPAREAGAVRWLRENLFSGWLNVLLTVLATWLLWVVLRDALPWAWRGIWRADNVAECRAIRDELYGPGVPAACWAVITERWRQLVFGFYPAGELWRPPLALAIYLLAVAPVLFQALPRRLLWLAPAAPFLIYWLIWGGSVWGPLVVALGFALGVAAWMLLARAGRLLAILGGVAAALLFWAFLDGPLTEALSGALPLALPSVRSADIGGFTLSTIIGLAGITLSLPLGVLLALARRSEMWLVSKIAVIYIEVIRGVPLIVWLLTAQILLNYFLPPGTNFDILLRVVIMVTLFASAYIAEVVRGGLAALPRGQFEAGDSLGLDYWQSMRLIVLPQALKISIPGHRQLVHRAPQGHDAGVHHLALRSDAAHLHDPRHDRMGGDLLGALHLRGGGLLRRLLRHVPLFHVARAAARAQPPIREVP